MFFFICLKDTEVLFPPPPPPPDSIKNLPKTEREALTSMLMSYYMSGFHTGLFAELLFAMSIIFIILVYYYISLLLTFGLTSIEQYE